MTETTGPDAPPADNATTAGAMLRQAREARGLHLAALAATMKVAPAKLEALEADRYADLPDLTFARALAQAMCRTLKIDAPAVLALLPRGPSPVGLERVASGLNTPFRDHADRADPWRVGLSRGPLAWAGAILLLAALAVYFVPAGVWFPHRAPEPTALPAELPASTPDAAASAASAASAAFADEAERVVAMAGVAAAGASVEAAAASAPASAPGGSAADGLARVRAREASWVEVRDGGGAVLLARTLQPGESVGLNGALPLRFKIGNAAVTELNFRGQPVDLAAATRDNIARLELK